MKMFGKGFDFRSFLNDINFWHTQEFRSMHSMRNTFNIMYGRKKDRGHIKQKYKKLIKNYYLLEGKVRGMCRLYSIGGQYGRF